MKKDTKDPKVKEENNISKVAEEVPAVKADKELPFKVAATKVREIRLEPKDDSPITANIIGGTYRIAAVSKDGRWGQLHNGRGWIDLSVCTVIE